MAATKFSARVERTGDRQIDRAQRNAAATAETLNANPLTPARVRLIEGITIAGGASFVAVHGLGRRARPLFLNPRTNAGTTLVWVSADDDNSATLSNGGVTSVTFDALFI